ncbi:ATP-dependent DNA helicase [Trichonephila inaurata madagascariensis]|uniref:ATP-dependent DNA helicase n=1 Tax=Trichonephila inaurata madagascariensis TaxID=2747483 RepID=A0A8X6YE02_9ARAC|nr:ATP-dependent DNA helicase [Trichonephila inaurata madagascariensis]
MSHTIIRLPVHMQNMQMVHFFDNEERQALERAAQRNDALLAAWFELNRTDPDVNRYLYADITKHFVWKNNDWGTELCPD